MTLILIIAMAFFKQDPPSRPDQDVRLDVCVGEGQQYQPSLMPRLVDTSITMNVNDEPAQVRLEGENVVVQFDRPSGANTYILEVDSKFRNGPDIDVELSFVLLDGEIVVRWKETFVHRAYRQGLFRVQGSGIEEICTGTGEGR